MSNTKCKSAMKPILFSTEMVRAILDGRKSVTRRVVKPQPKGEVRFPCYRSIAYDNATLEDCTADDVRYIAPPYRHGDMLYVRETWAQVNKSMGMGLKRKRYIYRANYSNTEVEGWKWRPSIHMPREAARIFLRVTDVRVERLQEITPDEVCDEGLWPYEWSEWFGSDVLMPDWKEEWAKCWDSTIKPADRERYGWAANPWVWVIAFERCEKPI